MFGCKQYVCKMCKEKQCLAWLYLIHNTNAPYIHNWVISETHNDGFKPFKFDELLQKCVARRVL